MKFKMLTRALAVVAVALPVATTAAEAYELTIPGTVYRTGPYAPNGIPWANGVADYYAMLNERDGGMMALKSTTSNAKPPTTPSKALSATRTPRAQVRVLWPINRWGRVLPIR